MHSTVSGQPGFATTQWGLLLAGDFAADQENAAQAAWEHLYRTYCRPVYTFIRRRGFPPPEAQDLTQDFFIHLVERHTLQRANPEKGRFRSFLLGALEYFLVDAARRANAFKRGGGCRFVFLDDDAAADCETLLTAPAAQTPERLFEAHWASMLVDAAFARLHEEMTAAGKSALFDVLRGYVVGEERASYQQTADTVGLSLEALKSVVRRLRGRYGVLLRAEIARTVADPGEVDAELQHLRDVLRAR